MKKTIFLISLIVLICNVEANAVRSMYVDGFASILGDVNAENDLLSYAQSNGIETLLLYELHIVNANYNLTNPETNYVLADFISKAKTSYGIVEVGALAENGNFFTNVIDVYNNSRSDPNEKFDIYNLEFEFWNESVTGPGGYYCTTYLIPNDLPCTNDGAFEFFVSTLETMNDLANNNSHPISVEAYVGWPTTQQAYTIGANLDRLLLHAYVSNPNTAFTYTANRLIDFANGTPGLDVSIIFSSEPNFMQNWLVNHSMTEAEDIYTTTWEYASTSWPNNINLVGFTYFTYSYNTNVFVSLNNPVASEELTVYPNPVQNTLSIENITDLKSIRIYDNIGKLILETQETKIDFDKLTKGIYLVQIYTDNGIETRKIVKE